MYANEEIEVRLLLEIRPTKVTLPIRPAMEAEVENETQTNERNRDIRNQKESVQWETECPKIRET